LLLGQEIAGSLAHGAASAGFLLFALCVPEHSPDPKWRNLRRGLPIVAIIVTLVQLASYANAFGYPTEPIARATFFIDFAVNGAALWILMRRRRGQAPQNYQRMQWIIAGALIGLPAYTLSGILGSTGLWQSLSGENAVPQDLINLLFLIYGILGWFVFE